MEILSDINTLEMITFNQSFTFAQFCSSCLNEKENEALGRRIIINILENWYKIPEATHEIWTDLIEAAGFYPYLEKYKENFIFSNISGQIRKELHVSENLNQKYFHEEQLEILNIIKEKKNLIVSAPTSFGKSLMIEEIIASNLFRNIIIIQPTLALLDETRKKLFRYNKDFKLIVRTSQVPSLEKGNIFLFTAERVNEYDYFQEVDFLVIDEFYKLSGRRDDERSSSLNNAFYYLLKKYKPQFYLLGPNIDSISYGFAEKYNAVFYKSNYSLVDSQEINIFSEFSKSKTGTINKKEKEEKLFRLLLELNSEQNIIYCSSPARVRELSKKFAHYLVSLDFPISNKEYSIVEWISLNVSDSWSLINNLKYDIGIHDGALQKHITTAIIDYFNNGKIKYLFCTSTIIEGVNTSAKNIIYYDQHKGLKPNGRPKEIDYFDYSNIKGRAGRLMEHFLGRIYNFNTPPQNENIIIDIPFFEQNPIKDEVLIQLTQSEVINLASEQYKNINEIPFDEKEIIKKNGVKVHGQKSIIDILRQNLDKDYDMISWRQPRYRQLEYVLKLAWDHLIMQGETTRPMTLPKLVNMTFNYAIHKDIRLLVQSNYDYKMGQTQYQEFYEKADVMDLAIQETFQIMKHWFQYKIPKWLSVMNEIQKFVCAERGYKAGNYLHYANLIENDFIRENLAILSEYGIPNSAIRKLEEYIPTDLNQDDVLKYIKENKLVDNKQLLRYEKSKIDENLNFI
jgi:hypothetical protein